MAELGTYLPRGMYRNRGLLDLAHGFDHCQNCGMFAVGGCEPAHSNLQEHGRGKDNKAHDCFFAALCHHCHAWLDFGEKQKDPSQRFEPTRAGKGEMFCKAMHATMLDLWRRAKLKVA